jgi:hypothetical protein
MSLITLLYPANSSYWNLYHKVIFDPIDRLIYINEGVTDINIQLDIYSASKEWMKVENNLRWKRPMRVIGGDPIPGTIDVIGRTYFLINGWRIKLEDSVNFSGNLYSENFSSPILVDDNVKLARSKFSNLVDAATIEAPTVDQIAAAVWSRILTNHTERNSAGKLVIDTERKTDDNQALIMSR